MRAQDRLSLRRLFGENTRNARLQNPGLFRRDLRECVAEESLMVEIDGRDDASAGVTTLVASRRPPIPTSSTTVSTCSRAKAETPWLSLFRSRWDESRARPSRAFARRAAWTSRERFGELSLGSSAAPRSEFAPSAQSNAAKYTGPCAIPAALNPASIIAHVDPLPFVPATWT